MCHIEMITPVRNVRTYTHTTLHTLTLQKHIASIHLKWRHKNRNSRKQKKRKKKKKKKKEAELPKDTVPEMLSFASWPSNDKGDFK